MIKYNNQIFDKIIEFDCRILYFGYNEGGSYFTTSGVSPLDYREISPTQAKVIVKKERNNTIFNIYSDWGKLHQVIIDNIHQKEINFAIQQAIEQKLLYV